MRVLVTGSNGFIGKNLVVSLGERGNFSVMEFSKEDSLSKLENSIKSADFIVHLAGVNRPLEEDDFQKVKSKFKILFGIPTIKRLIKTILIL